MALVPPAEYLPEGEEPKVFASMIAPPGYNLAEMHAVGRVLNEELAPLLEDDPARFERGESAYPALATMNIGISAGGIRVIAEPKRPGDIDALMAAFNARFREVPGMRAFSARGSIISSNDGGTRSVNIDIAGPDLGQLYAAAEAAFREAEGLFEQPQLNSQPSSLSLDQPLLEVRPDWERLAELGFTAQGFGFAVAALSDGAFVDEFVLADDKIDIRVYGQAGSAQDIDALQRLPLATPGGAVLPLGSLAELRDTVDTDAIRRVDGRRTVTVSIVPPRSVALESAVERVEAQLLPALRAQGLAPPGVTLEVSGAADQLEATRQSLGANFVIATVLSYLLLVAVFMHWGWPLMILTIVPLGLAGGIIGLALVNALGLRVPFDMITMLGFLILLGTVVNNPILVVDRTRQLLGQDGTGAAEAVRQAVASRLRPILMTTLTTVFGLAPLVAHPRRGNRALPGPRHRRHLGPRLLHDRDADHPAGGAGRVPQWRESRGRAAGGARSGPLPCRPPAPANGARPGAPRARPAPSVAQFNRVVVRRAPRRRRATQRDPDRIPMESKTMNKMPFLTLLSTLLVFSAAPCAGRGQACRPASASRRTAATVTAPTAPAMVTRFPASPGCPWTSS